MSNEFKDISSDVEGFWSSEGSVTVIPRECHLFDNSVEKQKVSCLILAELVETDGDENITLEGEPVDLPKGAQIGIWYKPGMRPILQCAGVVTRLIRDENKDKTITGKPLPMKGFRVQTAGAAKGLRLPVSEDRRKVSAMSATPFGEPKKQAEGMANTGAITDGYDADDDRIPF